MFIFTLLDSIIHSSGDALADGKLILMTCSLFALVGITVVLMFLLIRQSE